MNLKRRYDQWAMNQYMNLFLWAGSKVFPAQALHYTRGKGVTGVVAARDEACLRDILSPKMLPVLGDGEQRKDS